MMVDKKVANREGHLRDLRNLIKKVRALDQKVDEQYLAVAEGRADRPPQGSTTPSSRSWTRSCRSVFPKFFYKQKVLEDMIVVAGNVHEKFQASLRHIQELEAQRKSAEQQAAIAGRTAEDATLEQFVRMPREEFYKTFGS